MQPLPFAEFFSGIGLVRSGLRLAGWDAAWANDIDLGKAATYKAAFGDEHLRVGDIAAVRGSDIPNVLLATASFPCVDLSLAGYRQGLDGLRSGTLKHFLRVIGEMGARRPSLLVLENVLGFASSRQGADLTNTIAALNELGYSADVMVVDAINFVPQSRPRLLIVADMRPTKGDSDWAPSKLRPPWVMAFRASHPGLRLHARPLRLPLGRYVQLPDVIERMDPLDHRWWSANRVDAFVNSMAPLHRSKLELQRAHDDISWTTAYRRTRDGVPRAELRTDGVAGCLRAMRGGSSRQILVEAGRGLLRVRFMTPGEYGRLMGVPDTFPKVGGDHQQLFGFGDAVCVPVFAWLANQYLTPVASRRMASAEPTVVREAS
jgi:DNA (cytosine-5)-methyltransferase 1